MDLSEQTNQTENKNNHFLLSLKEPYEPDEPDLEYNYTKTSYDDELDQRRINMGHFGVSDVNFRGHNLEDAKRDVPFQIFYELDKSVHLPKHNKKRKKIQVLLDDFGENSSEEEEKSAANIDWREVESVTRQSLYGSDHDKPLTSVDLLEDGINPNDIPKEFPERSCYITIQRIITSWFLSIQAYIDSFTKTNKKNQ